MPYIERSDGSLLDDSNVIIEQLSEEHRVELDSRLGAHERALATLALRTIEDSMYFAGLYSRWVDPRNWRQTRDAYFAALPGPIRVVVGSIIRRNAKRAARGQGTATLTQQRRDNKIRQDISAIDQILGGQDYFFGEPSSIDAALFGFTANMLWAPTQSAAADYLREQANIVTHAEAIKARYWPDWPGPLATRLSR